MFQEAPINYGNVVSGSVTPPPALNGTYFYSRITGYLITSVTGLHTIGVNCQDGCNLFIGDAPLVANLAGGDTALTSLGYTRSSTIMLTAGVYYPITIEWQHGGAANYQLQLIWTQPLGSPALIPAANLSNTQSSITEVLNVSFWNGTVGLWYPGGNGTIDFANPAHPNKTLDNIPDGTARVLLSSSDVSSAVAAETARAEAAEAALAAEIADIVPMTATVGGLVPTPPDDATQYLDGTGNFSIPAGGGGGGGALVLLEEHSASSSAYLDFTSLSSAYDEYVIEVIGLVGTSSGFAVLAQLSTDGGTTFDSTSSDYIGGSHYTRMDASGSGDNSGETSWAGAYLTDSYNGVQPGVSGSIKFFNPASASYRQFTYQMQGPGNGGGYYTQTGAAIWLNTTQVNAIRMLCSNGNITSGTIRLYGVAN